MGGGFFDDRWDPYSGVYAHPRARHHSDRARSSNKGEEQLRKKAVRTIPVTDGGVAQREVAPRLGSEDAAATKVQTAYRGYAVRKTLPVVQLRVVREVKEELESLERRLREPEQERRLRSDAQERLRWTEGVMALLLRLDTLQGVHPEVRLVRRAVTKEIIRFQEMIDSMSGNDEATAHGAPTAEEKSFDDQATEEDPTFDKHVPQVHSAKHDQAVAPHGATGYQDERGPLRESVGEELGFSSEADPEAPPMDADKEEPLVTPVSTTKGEPASSSFELPAADTGREPFEVEDSVAAGSAPDVTSEQDASVAYMERREETDRLTEEAERPALQDNGRNDVSGSNSDACQEDTEASSGCTDQGDGWMMAAGCTWSLEPQSCIDSLQVSQPSTADDINALSDRALLLQLVEENRKLKDVVGKVLHWGKHQSDVMHNLAARIQQLEEDHPEANLLGNRGDREIARQKGLRKGNSGDRLPLGDDIRSEDWPSSAESDEYF